MNFNLLLLPLKSLHCLNLGVANFFCMAERGGGQNFSLGAHAFIAHTLRGWGRQVFNATELENSTTHPVAILMTTSLYPGTS